MFKFDLFSARRFDEKTQKVALNPRNFRRFADNSDFSDRVKRRSGGDQRSDPRTCLWSCQEDSGAVRRTGSSSDLFCFFRFLMIIDHCFSVTGQGNVITGTIIQGVIRQILLFHFFPENVMKFWAFTYFRENIFSKTCYLDETSLKKRGKESRWSRLI